MKPNCFKRSRRGVRGFSLVEEVIAMGIVAILSITFMSSLGFVKTQRYRDRDAGVVTDFLSQYIEHLKALPLDSIVSGRPLNALYDGSQGAPLIVIPESGQWVSLTGEDYHVMHPELVWLEAREPQFRMTVMAGTGGDLSEGKHAKLELRWLQPLSGRYLTNRLDLLRVKDV